MRLRPLTTAAALAPAALATTAALVTTAFVTTAFVTTAPAAAAGAPPARAPVRRLPLPGRADVRSASLGQSGRSLVWTTTLVHGIGRDGIASGARRLCLELETPRTRVLERTLCLTAPARRTRLGLARVITRGGHRVERPLPAAVTRSHLAHTVTAVFSPVALGLPYRSLRWQVWSAATGTICPITAPVDGGPRHPKLCAVTFPAHARLARLHTPRLVGCVPAGPSLVYHGPTNRREIALTFDDGPWSDPPSIDFVNELKRLGVPATFFEIGEQISEFDPSGAVERAMLADGDMIGNHTWSHPEMTRLSPAAQTAQLAQTNASIRRATGFTPCLWRPPYGATDPQVESLARTLGLLTVNWNDDTRDWALPGTGAIVGTALAEASDGGIVIMHFGGGPRLETLQAVPQIVAGLRARGYRFVNLVQLLGLREIWR
ncbi:MAG TPA: polysaccharide deacetylase family protein [Solirubrobacteraceae bacterium]|nr:polysaccharide deacetylase family protein [Solirubrobacteraceae bacterium]